MDRLSSSSPLTKSFSIVIGKNTDCCVVVGGDFVGLGPRVFEPGSQQRFIHTHFLCPCLSLSLLFVSLYLSLFLSVLLYHLSLFISLLSVYLSSSFSPCVSLSILCVFLSQYFSFSHNLSFSLSFSFHLKYRRGCAECECGKLTKQLQRKSQQQNNLKKRKATTTTTTTADAYQEKKHLEATAWYLPKCSG